MKQLTQQDAVFLSIETPSLPAHIGGMAFLEPVEGIPFNIDSFRQFVRERFTEADRFGSRIQEVPFGLDRPYWVRAENFDAADHVFHAAVPQPYSNEALSELVGRIFERPMDRSRPLWDMTLIDGLPGGGSVMLWRTHHCMMDGASGAGIAEQLFDIAPDAVRPPTKFLTAPRDSKPRKLEVTLRAIGHALDLPAQQAKYIRKAASALTPDLNPLNLIFGSEETPETDPVQEESSLAPKAPFNSHVSGYRRIAWSSVSLDEIKKIKKTMSVTVNDVVLALTGGAVRGYLGERDQLPEESLIASVPVSLRKEDDQTIGNQIGDMSVFWGTNIEDPVERLLAINKSSVSEKGKVQRGEHTNMMDVLSKAFMPGAVSALMRGIEKASDITPLPANAVVSNVPMTPFPLYLAGARITKSIPVSLLAPTQGLNVTVLSYCGELHFGLVHDPELVPDAWELAERIPKSLQELQSSVDRWQATDGQG
ncbi:MAG: wax ester/triacylglycerol synthase family O-acyltransferase [Myxococcota bacterium]